MEAVIMDVDHDIESRQFLQDFQKIKGRERRFDFE